MLLNELTDQQVANTFIDPNQNQRRQDGSKTNLQLSKEKGEQFAADRESKDPLKMRIAQLRQQLAQLVLQDQKKTADEQRRDGQPTQQGQPPAQPQGQAV